MQKLFENAIAPFITLLLTHLEQRLVFLGHFASQGKSNVDFGAHHWLILTLKMSKEAFTRIELLILTLIFLY